MQPLAENMCELFSSKKKKKSRFGASCEAPVATVPLVP